MKNAILVLAFVQVFLIISMVPAFSYEISETNSLFNGARSESQFVTFLRKAVLNYLSNGLVSAQSTQGLFTCVKDKQGRICQEYESSECNSKCSTNCLPLRREDSSDCNLGTCIDPSEGVCNANSPKKECMDLGGKWDERTKTEIPECKPGCCIIQGETSYLTENSCSILESRTGEKAEFKAVSNEIECLVLANSQKEGACVLDKDETTGKNNCKFQTQTSCLSSGGEFHEGILCSNPELNTICEKQTSTSCLEGKDEVYWLDSCGNRENIYDTNKIRSYNDGKVLTKENSCSLGSSNSPLSNQDSCGNCNYFLGSICGKSGEIDKKAIQGDFVCKDLRCIDDKKETRENGESWCVFEGQIGLDGEDGKNSQRSVDVPGSRHYQKVCLNGEITVKPCQDFRNEVCIESKDKTTGFSSTQCVLNRWQLCLNANKDKESLNKCEENSACFLKHVDIDDKFKFDVCAPKHPGGFNLDADLGGEVGQGICALGSQTCTYVEVKEAFGGWECKANCNCKEKKFTEQMNNLCMSLGDCGASVNVIGEFSDDGIGGNKRLKKLSENYIAGLKKYSEPKEGQKVDSLTGKEIASVFGIDSTSPEFNDNILLAISGIGAGVVGVDFALASLVGVKGFGTGLANIPSLFGAESLSVNAMGYSGAFLGAAIGAAAVSFAIKILGLGPGLSPAVQYALIAGGAFSGGVFGYSLIGGTSLFGPGAGTIAFSFGIAAIVIAAAVIAILVIGKLLGWGDTRERKVVFSCLPWQPPSGGASCSRCGEDGLGCSAYQCQSLGQSCQIVNEDTDEVACVDVSPDDVSPPTIKPLEGVLETGFSYSNVNSNGYKLTGPGKEGCIPAFTKVILGIQLNERGQCKVEETRTNSYEDMSSYFSGGNLYKVNHTSGFLLPSLEQLGISNINPETKQEYNLYVRCLDSSGNSNAQEYVINFCLSPEKDTQPPIIKDFSPKSPAYVSFNGTSKEIKLFTNEPAECRWSKQDQNYDLMANKVECENDFEGAGIYGWACKTTLPITTNEEKTYFRCKDQPWLDSVPEDKKEGRVRNTNSESVVYEIKRSATALKIVDKKPSGKLDRAGLPIEVSLEVKTEGGADSLPRYCYYNFAGTFSRFIDSGTNLHKQRNWKIFTEGKQTIPIKCEDDAGNIALDKIEFFVGIDTTGPRITRAYQQNGLTIITNENSQCAYSFETCNFNFQNGTLMSGTQLIHTTSFDEGNNYKIKCKDTLGNVGACLIIQGGLF